MPRKPIPARVSFTFLWFRRVAHSYPGTPPQLPRRSPQPVESPVENRRGPVRGHGSQPTLLAPGPERGLESRGNLQQEPVRAVRSDDLQPHRQPGRGGPGRDGDRRAAGDGDQVGRAHPVQVGLHRPAVDRRGVLLVGRERRHLRDRQQQDVVRPEELAHRLGEGGALGVGAGDVGSGERLAGPDVVGQRRLEGLGALGQQRAEARPERPGPQGAEGVVGEAQVGVGAEDPGAGAGDGAAGVTRPRSVTSASTSNAPPRSGDQATRSPESEPVSGGAKAEPGSPSAVGTRGSGPARTESSSATSPTVRAIGPLTEVVSHRLSVGQDGHPAERGPQADDAAERRRVAQRAAHVGAVGERDHAGGQGGRSPAGGAARGTGRVGRVPGGAEDRVEGVGPGGELGHVGLAEDDDARAPDPFHDEVVGVGHVVGEQRRAVRRPPARDVVGVLEGVRQAVQRPDRCTGGEVLVGRGRAGPGPLLVEADDRVELGVALGDPGQVQVEQLARRDPAAPDGGRQLAGGRVDGEVAHRRRPRTAPATTPRSTRPAPTAMPLRKSSRDRPAARAGAV